MQRILHENGPYPFHSQHFEFALPKSSRIHQLLVMEKRELFVAVTNEELIFYTYNGKEDCRFTLAEPTKKYPTVVFCNDQETMLSVGTRKFHKGLESHLRLRHYILPQAEKRISQNRSFPTPKQLGYLSKNLQHHPRNMNLW